MTVIFEETREEDGTDQEIWITRDNISDMYDFLDLCTQAAQAATFSGVDSMAYMDHKGKITWGR